MKKLIAMVLLIILVTTMPVGAIQIKNTKMANRTWVHTDTLNNNPKEQAEMLKALGLFLGTAKGFELDRSVNRVEAAVMLVRMMGKEAAVLKGSWRHPFNDIPKWADKYIGWLYQNKVISGVGKTTYGSTQKITFEEFAVLLSRGINGDDHYESHGIATADEVGLWKKSKQAFNRDSAVGLITRVLSTTYDTEDNKNSYSVAQLLIRLT